MVKSARFGPETYLLPTIFTFKIVTYIFGARVAWIFCASTVSHTCVYLGMANVVASLEGPFRLSTGSKSRNKMKERTLPATNFPYL